jgi:hypothetical protein
VLYSMNVTVMFIVCGSMTAFKMAISTFLCILQITIFWVSFRFSSLDSCLILHAPWIECYMICASAYIFLISHFDV